MFLKFKVVLTGNGVVNFDKSDNIPKQFKSKHENVKYAKVLVKNDKDGNKIREQLFISSGCIKNALFKAISGESLNSMPENWRASQYAKPVYLLKGWMRAAELDTYKRKSPLVVTSAVEVSGAVPTLSVGKTEGSQGKTSFFDTETVGPTKYELEVFLDLASASFIALDPRLDRLSLPDDIVNGKQFRDSFKKHFGVELPAVDTYVRNSDQSETPEKGILLGNKEVLLMAKYLHANLKDLKILRASGYAAAADVKATLHAHLNDKGSNWDGETLDLPSFYTKVSQETQDSIANSAIATKQVKPKKAAK